MPYHARTATHTSIMKLAFNARQYAPLQPMDNPEQFPPYELLPGRKDVNNPDDDWRLFQYKIAADLGWDGDQHWVEQRVQTATMYAKEDGTYGQDASAKRSPGRPLLYPMIPGESPEARAKRLLRERKERTKRAVAQSSPARQELHEARVAMAAAQEAYKAARARVALAEIAVAQETAQRG
jgi:hypothetical protein